MTNDALAKVDEEIQLLIQDKKEYGFNQLKERVEAILKDIDIFIVDNCVDSKAIDLYLKTVINGRNEIKKQEEKMNTPKTKYELIEIICSKIEFNSKEAVIKKIEELEKKTIEELNHIHTSL